MYFDHDTYTQSFHPMNQYTFSSLHGDKSVELYQGDIMEFPKKTEILVFSAFSHGYYPSPGTLIESFEKKTGLSMEKIAEHPMLDLRDDMGIWVSHKLEGTSFKYVICVEMMTRYMSRTSNLITEKLRNLFRVLEILDPLLGRDTSIIMPLLGTGRQGIAPDIILGTLLAEAQATLERSRKIKRIYLMEFTPEKADIICKAMDVVLGREPQETIGIVTNPETNALISSMQQQLLTCAALQPELAEIQAVKELVDVLTKPENSTFSNLAINCRRVLEAILHNLTDPADTDKLVTHINCVAGSKYFPEWVTNYMHLVRCLGNSGAHSKTAITEEDQLARITFFITAKDQKALLIAMTQILDSYQKFLQANGSSARLKIHFKKKF